jgi:Fe-S cluster assembly ATPase SufC
MDIHPSDFAELKDRVSKKNYTDYLVAMTITARAFNKQKVSFDFPVTAIIGTNGGGKSTILGAAAIAYKSTRPKDFFPKSNVGDDSMWEWRIDYELLYRKDNPTPVLNRNAHFSSSKWRRDHIVSREVIHFPIQRTVPANEQTRYKKFIGMQRQTNVKISMLPEAIQHAAGRILGKDLSGYQVANIPNGAVLLLGLQKKKDFSQFHFGAGEASIIEMVQKIEKSQDYSLILIEEIENGLHPIAIQKTVEYLISVAKTKKLQVIFTTHSEYALKILPQEAILACIDGEAYQGKLSIESLRAITGNISKEKIILVEADFAKRWVEDIIRQASARLLEIVEVHVAGGYPYVLQVAKHHNDNPSIKTRAVAIMDGDASSEPDPKAGIYKLPGSVPEREIYDFVHKSLIYAAFIKQRCQCPGIGQDKLVKIMDDVARDTTDPHLLFEKLGDKLGFISSIVISGAFISIYNENKKPLNELLDTIKVRPRACF